MNDLEEVKTRLAYEVAIYKGQLNMLRREIERISLTTLDLANAARTAQGLRQGEVMISIGGGAYVKGKIAESTVIVPVGAEYLIEMDAHASAQEIEKRVDATKKAIGKLNEEFGKISDKLKEVAGKLQEIEVSSKLSNKVDENAQDDYI